MAVSFNPCSAFLLSVDFYIKAGRDETDPANRLSYPACLLYDRSNPETESILAGGGLRAEKKPVLSPGAFSKRREEVSPENLNACLGRRGEMLCEESHWLIRKGDAARQPLP